jgi:hypothetical protein
LPCGLLFIISRTVVLLQSVLIGASGMTISSVRL